MATTNKLHNKAVVNYFLLLFPGAVSALLIFLISSNRLLPNNKDCTLLLLKFLSIQTLGITIVKYGIDQIIISCLQPYGRTATDSFFKKRVLPLTLIFCAVTAFLKGWIYAFSLLLILPMEVMAIIVTIELSVSNRIKYASLLTLLGNPLVFMLTFIAYRSGFLSETMIFIFFTSSSLSRVIFSLFIRNKGDKNEIAILSYHIPLQQVGNYFMFRLDQLIISSSLVIAFLGNQSLMIRYLFLAKFPEVTSGVIVSLAPILYKRLGDQTEASLKKLFKDPLFLLISIGICISQIIVCLFIFKSHDTSNSLLLLLPFVLSSLLILPANLVTYILLKNAKVYKINILNGISVIIGVILAGISLLSNNIYIFCMVVPVQLLIYIILFQFLYYKDE